MSRDHFSDVESQGASNELFHNVVRRLDKEWRPFEFSRNIYFFSVSGDTFLDRVELKF